MVKTKAELLLCFIRSWFWAAYWGGVVMGLEAAILNSIYKNDDFLAGLVGSLVLGILAILFSFVFAAPALLLGYLVSYALNERQIKNVWVWVSAGFIVAALTCFSMGGSDLWKVYLISGTLAGFFMWRQIKV